MRPHRIISVALGLSATVAIAATGIVLGEGYGADKAGACLAAKQDGQNGIALAAMGRGGAANATATHFSACSCSESAVSRSEATRWHCSVEVHWSNDK
jgi:hypothetical protein